MDYRGKNELYNRTNCKKLVELKVIPVIALDKAEDILPLAKKH